jgi:hypothetical protein
MYKNVAKVIGSCETCQLYYNIYHRDGLHPTCPLAIHYRWVVDLVAMPTELEKYIYLIFAQEDLSN